MIGLPFDDNDLHCLGWMSEILISLLDPPDPRLVELAQRMKTTAALAAWIRSLPQRDDQGIIGDGFKVDECRPAQRLRIMPDDPNCVERAALYVLVAELIDPRPVRRLSTLDYAWGRHTYPIEDGVPIVLDPRVTYEELVQAVANESVEAQPLAELSVDATRNRRRTRMVSRTADATAHEGNSGVTPPNVMQPQMEAVPVPYTYQPSVDPYGGPYAIDIGEAISFTGQLAERGAAETRNGPRRTHLARNAIQDVVSKGAAPTDPRTVDAISSFFSTAERVAHDYGPRALRIVRTTALAISDLIDDILARRSDAAAATRNLSLEIGGRSFGLPSWLSDVGSLVGKIGLDVGALALAPKLGALGITGSMLELVEQELNAEGLSLGPLKDSKHSFTSALSSLSRRRVA